MPREWASQVLSVSEFVTRHGKPVRNLGISSPPLPRALPGAVSSLQVEEDSELGPHYGGCRAPTPERRNPMSHVILAFSGLRLWVRHVLLLAACSGPQ